MSAPTNPLFDLLPALHRLRDHAEGGPLRALLGVVGDELAVLEESLEQFYDDQFIETCADWVVPYLGDLIGYRSLHHSVPSLRSPRAEVADTLTLRRSKGSVPALEQLATAVTGWPCRVVEYFERLQTTQFMNHPRRHAALTPDLRRWRALADLGTGFDGQAHSIDTRPIALGEGRHNIPHIGFHLWRIAAARLQGSPAAPVDALRFRFHPLGIDAALHRRVEPRPADQPRNGRAQIPAPISRREAWETPAAFYGADRSFFIEGVAPEAVRICDLSDDGADWSHTPPPAGLVAIDPVLGRIAFAEAPLAVPEVTFHYGQALAIGGGEYERGEAAGLGGAPPDTIAMPADLALALAGRTPGTPLEIVDNGCYAGPLALDLGPGELCNLRAANRRRPTVLLGGDFTISGGDGEAELVLDGLLLAGGTLRVSGGLRRLRLVDCTLVPGLSLLPGGAPLSPGEPSLVVESAGVTVELERCVVGPVWLHELAQLHAVDSILDACAAQGVALAGPLPPSPGGLHGPAGSLRLEECTVIGKLRATQVELVSNCILFAEVGDGDPWPAPVLVERKQTGCVRFSWLPVGARTPGRFRCQPDLEIARQLEAAERAAKAAGTSLSPSERSALSRAVAAWMKPAFTSQDPGHPGYGQLRRRVPGAIRRGADDESAMGATHRLYEAQRLTNLSVRLDEYLRFGLQAGTFFAS